ncbi:deoxyribodipyrimidine photo-lyase [Craterilacuibacter sp. RT1T]|uniref:cryptochrome/photolyase family protein n=1 Tax=Craterilacuibacter sp. RT1T TaxID=2942211 RepID=UPI0020BF0512|nr:deoxyribodipyrimidine photo-lyase [Craterilacuibacter sp. RT1T]MCL6263620.1 DNA photolyase family protein [Craterilacuibacter sp. RT1T]
MNPSPVLCWLRRDLRLSDHAALSRAQQCGPVLAVFVFDPALLAGLPRNDKRVTFICAALDEIRAGLRALGSELVVCYGDPLQQLPRIAQDCAARQLFFARDYEPMALARDAAVTQALQALGVEVEAVKDQVVFEQDELLTKAGQPYSVFTPYARAWRARLTPASYAPWQVKLDSRHFAARSGLPAQWLGDEKPIGVTGFTRADLAALNIQSGERGARVLLKDFATRIARYSELRDYPARKGVSYLSAHLRFGTVSIRELVRLALGDGSAGAMVWLNELIWREFYQQWLWHFPTAAHTSFKPAYRTLRWPGEDSHFAAWCAGQTGYPLVDAAMRQLNETGYMHNRLRMVAASFLVKDLLIDWQRGERYFASQLLDYDMAANCGGWQWAASTGCDAQPWFRIFNPVTQSQKFDADGQFIRRYVPELAMLDAQAIHAPWLAKTLPASFQLGRDYPAPIVEHASQREKALALFGR